MGILSGLKLVAANQTQRVNGIQRQRNKLAAKIDEQIEMATAKQSGANYAPRIIKSVTNPATGQRVQVEAYKRVRPWFWMSAAGGYCMNIRYGSKCIELSKGKNAVEVSDLNALTGLFKIVVASTRNFILTMQPSRIVLDSKTLRL